MAPADAEVDPVVEETARAIAEMETRGAAAIADAAAAALASQARHSEATTPEAFRAELRQAARTLYESMGFVEHERTADQFETSKGLTLRYCDENTPDGPGSA